MDAVAALEIQTRLTTYSNYTLNSDGVCHRTQVAVRIKTLKQSHWEQYVSGQLSETEQAEAKADEFIVTHILRIYYEEAIGTIRDTANPSRAFPPLQRDLLLRRWQQVKVLVQNAFTNSINQNIQLQTHQWFDLPTPARRS